MLCCFMLKCAVVGVSFFFISIQLFKSNFIVLIKYAWFDSGCTQQQPIVLGCYTVIQSITICAPPLLTSSRSQHLFNCIEVPHIQKLMELQRVCQLAGCSTVERKGVVTTVFNKTTHNLYLSRMQSLMVVLYNVVKGQMLLYCACNQNRFGWEVFD